MRRIAAVSAFLIVSSAITSAVAHADTPSGSTLYVSRAASCSDAAGVGTQAQPFCTVQAAVAVANPGQTVYIEQGTYPPTKITRSGTAAAPINIEGAVLRPGADRLAWIASQPAGFSLDITGSSYLNFSNLLVESGQSGAVSVSSSSNIVFDESTFGGGTMPIGYLSRVSVTGSQAVTIERAIFGGSSYSEVTVTGSPNTVISTSYLSSSGAAAISLTGAPGAVITGNSVRTFCHGGLSLDAGSTGAVIENNIVAENAGNCPASAAAPISVDPAASPTSTEDYDSLSITGAEPYYSWGGTDYTSIAQFSAATGEGAHDLVYSTSGAIDSANSAAPGELLTDMLGRPRIDIPTVQNTGAGPETYFDRGAIEDQGLLQVATFQVSATQAPTGSPVTFSAKGFTGLADGLTYDFDFGDGTTQTTTAPTISHVYTQTGSYVTSVTVSGVTGVLKKLTRPLTVVPPAPLVAAMSVSSAGTLTVVANNQSTDSWDITGFTVDFGDESTPGQELAPITRLIHSYTKLGTYTIKLTVTDSQGNTATTSQQFTTTGSEYTAYGPVRILDTRHGIGTGGATTPLGPNATLLLKIAGNGAIPANVSAVAFNLTVTGPTGGGYVTAFPDDQTRPITSNLNYTPGLTKATSVLVGVGADGEISLYNGSSGTVGLIVDVTGYFTKTMASGYTPLYPTRILDTRNGTGTGGTKAAVGAGKTLTLTIAGADSGALPASGINAVALNLTATDEATGGYVTAWPDNSNRPLASSVNFPAGQTVPNTVIVPVGADGKIDLYNGSGGTIDLVADVQGYFSTGGADAYLPVVPTRLYDSRTSGGPVTNNNGPYLQPLGPTVLNAALSTVAFVYNVTVTQPTGSGNVVVYPGNATVPQTSNVNFAAGQTTANTAIAQAGAIMAADNSFTVRFNSPSGNSTQLIVDLFGYFSAQ